MKTHDQQRKANSTKHRTLTRSSKIAKLLTHGAASDAAADTAAIEGGEHWDAKMIEDCRQIWLGYGGRSIDLIVAEMRRKGWPQFYKQLLYGKKNRGGSVTPGWPERFGWRRELGSELKAK